MCWDVVCGLFMTKRGRLTRSVPRSCIESAEYIMQCNYHGMALQWAAGASQTPSVYAYFGGGFEINISATPNFHEDPAVRGLADYDFKGLPLVGEGLICLNKTAKDLPYNMHLGAVLARNGTTALLSNMMEVPGISVAMVMPDTIEINAPAEFITRNMGPDGTKHYALGLLRIKA